MTRRGQQLGDLRPHGGLARDDEHRRLLADLAISSYMCVPLVSTSGTLGAMTFVFADSGRHYTDRDLLFAQDVAALRLPGDRSEPARRFCVMDFDPLDRNWREKARRAGHYLVD